MLIYKWVPSLIIDMNHSKKGTFTRQSTMNNASHITTTTPGILSSYSCQQPEQDNFNTNSDKSTNIKIDDQDPTKTSQDTTVLPVTDDTCSQKTSHMDVENNDSQETSLNANHDIITSSEQKSNSLGDTVDNETIPTEPVCVKPEVDGDSTVVSENNSIVNSNNNNNNNDQDEAC
ncbi:unnamed protein product [Schistosoma turkestanicum]|nr:unnamed protein product [Schistosoma turkestanicum]